MIEPLIIVHTRSLSPFDRAVAARLSALLGTQEEEEEAPSSALALPAPSPRTGRAELKRADLVLALDGGALEEAAEAGARRVALYLPRFDPSELGELDPAHRIYLPHAAMEKPLLALSANVGANRDRLEVVGPILPEEDLPGAAAGPGSGAGADAGAEGGSRRAQKEALGLPGDRPAVVIAAESLKDDLGASLVQLSLVTDQVSWLFDVGLDGELAERLRSQLPAYGLTAWLFAERGKAAAIRAAADLFVGQLKGPECIRALGRGVALALLPLRVGDLPSVADALEAEGRAHVADSSATLSVAIDAALRSSSEPFAGPGDGAERLIACLRAFARGEEQGLHEGLPRGLEKIDLASLVGAPEPDPAARTRPESSRPEQGAAGGPSAGSESAAPSAPKKKDPDTEIEDELMALKKRLGLDG